MPDISTKWKGRNNMNIKEYTKKDGTKVYRANVYLGVDSLTGKQVRKVITAKSEKMCNTKISRAINKFEKNGQTVRKVSVDDFKDIAMLWFDSYKLGVKSRTVQIMQTRLNNYVLPALGEYRIDKVNSIILQQIVNQWMINASQPLNGAYHRPKGKGKDFKIYFNIVERIFKHALSLGLVKDNPCVNVIVPKVRLESTEKKVKHLTAEQLKIFFEYIGALPKEKYTNELMTGLCRLLVASGLRIGEAVALSWSDIDFKTGSVSVSKTTLRAVIQSTPKTDKSNRIVLIDSKAVEVLKHWELFQAKYFMSIGKGKQELVFPNRTGGVLDYQTMRPFLIKWLRACQLPQVGFHGFRHSHASLLLNADVPYKEIQERLGHASIKMTMDTYSHLESDNKIKAVERFESIANF